MDVRSVAFACAIAAVGCARPRATVDRTTPTRSSAIAISFDDQAARSLIAWARSDAPGEPPEWRSLPAYFLTRLWAQAGGQPDPDAKVQAKLNELARDKRERPNTPRLVQTAALLSQVERRREDLEARVVPHLRSYLPAATPITGRVVLALFTPPYAFSWIGDDVSSIVINIDHPFWKGSADKVLNLLVHELFHNGFVVHQPNVFSPDERSPTRIVDELLWQTQNEGTATWVAYRVRPLGLEVEDYRLLDDAAEVQARFEQLRRLIADAAQVHDEERAELRKRIWREGVEARAFYVVGAAMARRIEEDKGRAALIATIKAGPRAFFGAYAATAPRLELRVDVPDPAM
jgi:hypothetical protein